MKRVMLVTLAVCMVALLASCGTVEEPSSEVSEFVEEFNALASLADGVEALDDTAEVDETGAQVLYSSPGYGVAAIYDEDGALNNYSVVISQNDPYEKLKGNALYTAMHVASVLGLDIKRFPDELEEALKHKFHFYLEGGYTVTFHNKKLSGDPKFGMVIEFSSE